MADERPEAERIPDRHATGVFIDEVIRRLQLGDSRGSNK